MKIGLILMLALLPTAAAAQTEALPSRDEVMAVVTREAFTEMARQKDLDAHGGRPHPTVSGVFVAATMRLDAPDVRDYALRAPPESGTIAFGDVYESLYARTGQPDTLMSLRQRLDTTLADLAGPTPRRPAWGCKDLFLTPAVYARMSVLTHDPKYLQAMDLAWARAADGLWDAGTDFPACGAFAKAMTLDDEAAVIAGLARVLEVMPADFPSRPGYVEQYQTLAARLIARQEADGQWRDPSGTARIAYALAFGLDHDLLNRETCLPVVLRAWAALNRDIRPDGLLDGNAGTSGAFILAGLEIARLNDPATPLPSPVIIHRAYATTAQTERPSGVFGDSTARHEAQTHPATRAVATNPVTDDPSERSLVPMPRAK